MTFDELLSQAVQTTASDLHLSPDAAPTLRVAGVLEKINDEPLTGEAIANLVLPRLPELSRRAFTSGATQWAETVGEIPGSS